ncbi:MAG: C39 family peptidase [Lachnospiraceae bacterium]|nr:C39 family peptidase [Lachnospiraceae bacterium]
MSDTELLQTKPDTDKEAGGTAGPAESADLPEVTASRKLRAFLTSAIVCAALLLLIPAAMRFSGIGKTSAKDIPAGEEAVSESSTDKDAGETAADAYGGNAAKEPLKEMKPDYEEHYRWLLDHEDLFPEGKVTQAKGNAGLTDFLYVYGHEGAEDTAANRHVYAKLTPADLSRRVTHQYAAKSAGDSTVYLDIPLLMQWDERWGYYPYGSSVIGLTGCGPTCLSMAVAGLTGNVKAAPDRIARFAEDEGYYMSGTGTKWSLFTEGAEKFRVNGRELTASLESIKEELDLGHPVIMSMGPGTFTYSGHFILAAGYMNDSLVIHDPNSQDISSHLWKFDRISDQILGVWAFSTSKQ